MFCTIPSLAGGLKSYPKHVHKSSQPIILLVWLKKEIPIWGRVKTNYDHLGG
jgi:hypothetical protein